MSTPASKKTVAALREELEERGLETTGLKAALVARLDEAVAKEAAAPAGDVSGKKRGRESTESHEGETPVAAAPKRGREAESEAAPVAAAPPPAVAPSPAKRKRAEESEALGPAPAARAMRCGHDGPALNLEDWVNLDNRHSQITGMGPFASEFE